MTTLAMTGLEKVAVLLKSLPSEVSEKVMRHLEPRHASLVSAALANLDKRSDLNQNLAGVLDEAVNILSDVSPKTLASHTADAKPIPAKNQTAPIKVITSDVRARNSSAPSVATINCTAP